MNKVLLITVSVLAVLASFETNASYCDVCCTEGVVFCPYTTENDVCTAGCGCCNLDTHDVMESKLKTGYWDCCKKGETVYWNGGQTGCCNAKAYKQSATAEACCTGATATNPTHKVVTVEGAPTADLETCCSIATYGENPTAYWDGTKAQCCKGIVACLDGDCICCPTSTCGTENVFAYRDTYLGIACCNGKLFDMDLTDEYNEVLCCKAKYDVYQDVSGESWYDCCAPNNGFTELINVDAGLCHYDGEWTSYAGPCNLR